MRRVLVTVSAALLAVAGACGNDSEPADASRDAAREPAGEVSTKEEFIDRGNAICRELSLATEVAEEPQDETDFARYLKDLRAPTEAAREHWELLEPAADGAEVHEAVLNQLTARLDALNGAVTAAESGDTVTAEDLRAQADDTAKAVDAQARAYGFTECGSGNRPGATDEPGDPSQIGE